MVFKYIRQNKKVESRKIYVYSSIQTILTSLVILSSFVVIDVPLFFIFPYLAVFALFLIMTLKYSDKLIRFRQDDNGDLIVNFEAVTQISYIVSTISRILISLLVLALRIKLLEIFGIEHTIYLMFLEPKITLIIFITIVFDLLLLSSKGVVVGMHRQMLVKNKKNLAGSEDKQQKQ